MLPGYIAGHYSYDEVHIDLRTLAAFAGARFFKDEVIGLDRASGKVLCKNRPPVPYDRVSINIGSTPQMSRVPGAAEHAVAVKPIHLFNRPSAASKIGDSSNESVKVAREQARASIIDSLEIHPVSAPELRKLLLDDEEDRPFLTSAEQTGIPQLQASLAGLALREKERKQISIDDITQRLSTTLTSEIQLIEAQWNQQDREQNEAKKLEESLKPILVSQKEEYRARAAAFRNFLDETVQAKIEALVLEARDVAEEDVREYLNSLRGAHWTTLRAAVRRGGTFYGSRNINLPDDITGYFMEPMAAVWGQKLLRDIRIKTTNFASDTVEMVKELCNWADSNGGELIRKELLQAQQDRIAALAKQMKSVGKEASDELRQTVKSELSSTIRSPIKSACEEFVRDGDDIGPGVKMRILELFARLAKVATLAAKDPAIRILKENAFRVRNEIQAELRKGGDPLQETADLIVETHESRMLRSDVEKRTLVLAEVNAVLKSCPKQIFSELLDRVAA